MKLYISILTILLLVVLIPFDLEAQGNQVSELAIEVTHSSHPTTLDELGTLDGAVVDPETGQLMLIGRSGTTALNTSDFIVALQTIYRGDFPAVSIDPIKNDLSNMAVTYYGDIEDTHLGYVLYEADRMLKIYSMGKDNLTGEWINSSVPAYQSELALVSADTHEMDQPVWHRMWFEPAQLTNPDPVDAKQRYSISLSELEVIAKTEYVSIDGSPIPNEGSDPAAEQFVAHFNDNFSAFASEQPVLQELVQVRRWLYLARWLRDAGIPVNTDWLAQDIETVETPDTTPRISVERDLGIYRLMLGGGVDFSENNSYPSSDPFAETLVNTLLDLPPNERAGTITFEGQNYTVVGIPLYEMASYSQIDESGRQLHFSTDDNRLLCIQDGEGVTNFDEYNNEGYLLRKTINYADDIVNYLPNDNFIYAKYDTELAAQADILALMVALTGQVGKDDSAQTVAYEHMRNETRLFTPEEHFLPIVNGGKALIVPLQVRDEVWIALKTQNAQVEVPENDLFGQIYDGTSVFQIVRGVTAVDLYSRMLTAEVSNNEVKFIYPVEDVGNMYLQMGSELVPIPNLTKEDLDDLLLDGDVTDFSDILAPILEFEGQIVFYSGAGFSQNEEGSEYEEQNRQRSDRLMSTAIQLGAVRIQADDEIEIAVNNLAAQSPLIKSSSNPTETTPTTTTLFAPENNVQRLEGQSSLVGQTGDWNLEIILDIESLSGDEVEKIIQVAEDANIPLQTTLNAPKTKANIMLITGQSDEIIREDILPQWGMDESLQNRYLILFIVDQAQDAQYLEDKDEISRRYVRTAIVNYNATGVMVNEEAIKLISVRKIIEELNTSKDKIQDNLPGQAVLQIIKSRLEQPDIDNETRKELEGMQRGIRLHISQHYHLNFYSQNGKSIHCFS